MPAAPAPQSNSSNPGSVPAIAAEGLVKRYGQLEVLKGIAFEARDGEVISILGLFTSG